MDLRTTRLQVGKKVCLGTQRKTSTTRLKASMQKSRTCSSQVTPTVPCCSKTLTTSRMSQLNVSEQRDAQTHFQAYKLMCSSSIPFFSRFTVHRPCKHLSSTQPRREHSRTVPAEGRRSHTRCSGSGKPPTGLAAGPTPTYILESLEAAPPVTLATRSCDSSTFRSSSCFSSSSFFFPRRSRALILACRRGTGRQPRSRHPAATPGPQRPSPGRRPAASRRPPSSLSSSPSPHPGDGGARPAACDSGAAGSVPRRAGRWRGCPRGCRRIAPGEGTGALTMMAAAGRKGRKPRRAYQSAAGRGEEPVCCAPPRGRRGGTGRGR